MKLTALLKLESFKKMRFFIRFFSLALLLSMNYTALLAQEPGDINALSKGITLDQSITIVLKNNPDVRRALFTYEEAKSRLNIVAGQLWPSLGLVSSYFHNPYYQRLTPPREPGGAITFTYGILETGLAFEMPLFTGGRIRREIESAEYFQESAKCSYARVQNELIYKVSSVYYSILGQQHTVRSLEFSQNTMREHRKLVESLMAVKKAARVDILRTNVRIADIEQKLVKEKNLLAIQRRLFMNLLGDSSNISTVILQDSLSLINIKLDLKECLLNAYRNREDYKSLLAFVNAQKKNVDVARAGYFPNLSVYGSIGRRWAVGSVIQPEGADNAEYLGQIGIIFKMPVLSGGRIAAIVQKEKNSLYIAEEELCKLKLNIDLEVETAVLNITSGLKRIKAIEKSITEAKETLRIEQEKYRLGKGAIIDILDAQSALLEMQTAYYKALAEYNISIAQLRFAGGLE